MNNINFNLSLVASAFSSILESPVVTYDEYIKNGGTVEPQQILSVNSIHKSFLITEEDIVGHDIPSPDDSFLIAEEDKIQDSTYLSRNSSTVKNDSFLVAEEDKTQNTTYLSRNSPTVRNNPFSIAEENKTQDSTSLSRNSSTFSTVNRLPISPTINRHPTYYPTTSRQINTTIPVSINSKPSAPPPPPRINTQHKNQFSNPRSSNESHKIQIFVSTLDSNQSSVFIDSNATVLHLKQEIYRLLNYGVPCQRIIFAGKQLNDDRSLSSYNIQHSSTVHLVFRLSGGLECYIITPEFLNPKYDFDFTNVTDGDQTFIRGNHLYKRPCGWNRLALNVSKKYESDGWLGVGRRNSLAKSVKGEWPVSYHGTSKDNATDIVDKGYLLSKGRRFQYGKGIYSSPDIEVAARFSKTFTHEGVNYKMVFQNRINPEGVKKVSMEETGIGEYLVSPNEQDIRPYGLCFKRV